MPANKFGWSLVNLLKLNCNRRIFTRPLNSIWSSSANWLSFIHKSWRFTRSTSKFGGSCINLFWCKCRRWRLTRPLNRLGLSAVIWLPPKSNSRRLTRPLNKAISIVTKWLNLKSKYWRFTKPLNKPWYNVFSWLLPKCNSLRLTSPENVSLSIQAIASPWKYKLSRLSKSGTHLDKAGLVKFPICPFVKPKAKPNTSPCINTIIAIFCIVHVCVCECVLWMQIVY